MGGGPFYHTAPEELGEFYAEVSTILLDIGVFAY